MALVSLGDLAYQFALSRQNGTLKQGLLEATQEVTTGVSSNLGQHLEGDFVPLASIERSLHVLSAYQTATAEARLTTDVMQQALGNVTDSARNLQQALLLAGTEPQATLIRSSGVDAEQKFAQTVATLNGSAAGRSLFAGAATDTAPLIDADAMMVQIRAAVASATTAQDVATAVQDWFHDAGGGFETTAYQGSTTPSGPMRLGDGQTLTLSITAADPALRDMLAGLATAALLSDPDLLGGDVQAQSALAMQAAESLLTAEGPMANLRGQLGAAQERIEEIEVQNSATATALEITRAELIGVDPYDAATKLEALQTQLETLYTITARVGRLNLADFLR